MVRWALTRQFAEESVQDPQRVLRRGADGPDRRVSPSPDLPTAKPLGATLPRVPRHLTAM